MLNDGGMPIPTMDQGTLFREEIAQQRAEQLEVSLSSAQIMP